MAPAADSSAPAASALPNARAPASRRLLFLSRAGHRIFPCSRSWCFIRELLLTFSLSSTTCDSAWVSRGFFVITHI